MKFGLSYNTGVYGTDPDQIIAVARHAEQCGFESLYFPEHIALYPGATVGPVTIPASTPVADPLECLAFVAAATERIVLGTGVLLLPYHQPVVLAKRLATLAVLSKGRMRRATPGGGRAPAGVGVPRGGGHGHAPRRGGRHPPRRPAPPRRRPRVNRPVRTEGPDLRLRRPPDPLTLVLRWAGQGRPGLLAQLAEGIPRSPGQHSQLGRGGGPGDLVGLLTRPLDRFAGGRGEHYQAGAGV